MTHGMSEAVLSLARSLSDAQNALREAQHEADKLAGRLPTGCWARVQVASGACLMANAALAELVAEAQKCLYNRVQTPQTAEVPS